MKYYYIINRAFSKVVAFLMTDDLITLRIAFCLATIFFFRRFNTEYRDIMLKMKDCQLT